MRMVKRGPRPWLKREFEAGAGQAADGESLWSLLVAFCAAVAFEWPIRRYCTQRQR